MVDIGSGFGQVAESCRNASIGSTRDAQRAGM